MNDDEFEAETDRILDDLYKWEANARADAEAILAAFPTIDLLDSIDESPTERYELAYIFMRAHEVIKDKANIYSIIELVEIVRSSSAAAWAALRHEPHRKAREFVIAEWGRHRQEYSGNKSAFARDYVKRVWNELGVTVTEKQLREVWLRDTPLAGKPAGEPAAGE